MNHSPIDPKVILDSNDAPEAQLYKWRTTAESSGPFSDKIQRVRRKPAALNEICLSDGVDKVPAKSDKTSGNNCIKQRF